MDDANPYRSRSLPLAAGELRRVLGTQLGAAFLFFELYTLSYGPWVAVGSSYGVPGGQFIHQVFYGPLHFLSAYFPPYGWLTGELFMWGYNLV